MATNFRTRTQAIECDPRIHCALVCGANSCPALRHFSEHNLDGELDAAARGFCNAETSVDPSTSTVTTSKIFMWYQSDFGESQEECLRWIARYLSDEKRCVLVACARMRAGRLCDWQRMAVTTCKIVWETPGRNCWAR